MAICTKLIRRCCSKRGHADSVRSVDIEHLISLEPVSGSFGSWEDFSEDRRGEFDNEDHGVELSSVATSALEALGLFERSLLEQGIRRTEPQPVAAAARVGWEAYDAGLSVDVRKRLVRGGAPGNERLLAMWRTQRVMKLASPRELFDILTDSSAGWNPYVESVTDRGSEYGSRLLQTVFKAVGQIPKREALEFRAASPDRSSSVLWIAYTSTGVEELGIEVPAGCVRAYTNLVAYRLAPGHMPNTTDLTLVSHIDAGGSLPDWVTEKAGPKGAMDMLSALQRELDRRSSTSGSERS